MKTSFLAFCLLMLFFIGGKVNAQTQQVDICALLNQMQTSVNQMGANGNSFTQLVSNANNQAGNSNWTATRNQVNALINQLNTPNQLSNPQREYLLSLANQIINAINGNNACCNCTPAPPTPGCDILGYSKTTNYQSTCAYTGGPLQDPALKAKGDYEFRANGTARFADGNDWIEMVYSWTSSTTLTFTLVGEGNQNSGVPMATKLISCTADRFQLEVGGQTMEFIKVP